MPYYQRAVPEEVRTNMEDMAFLQTPPASADTRQPDCDWATATSGEQQLLPSAAVSWPALEPQGLALFADLPLDLHPDVFSSVALPSRPFMWPSQLATTPQPLFPGMTGPDIDHGIVPFQPLPAMPSNTHHPWDDTQQPINPTIPIYEVSPSVSPYSTNSYLSTTSSPYAHSEGNVRTAGSPRIKLEGAGNRRHSTSRLHLNGVTLEHPFLVNPGNLVMQRAISLSDCDATPPLSRVGTPLNIKEEEVEPEAFQLPHRPSFRKSFSSNDVKGELLEDRQKRGYTRPEDASCSCDHCGKLFQRSYNLRVHLETHDQHRPQPHTCSYAGCDKRFVRRTDLMRHEQSVHLKARNYHCPMCDSSFARKDTLRRHVDDGCPRRPEVKKRMGKARRISHSTVLRRSSFHHLAQ